MPKRSSRSTSTQEQLEEELLEKFLTAAMGPTMVTLDDAVKGDDRAMRIYLMMAAECLWKDMGMNERLRRFVAIALARIAADKDPAMAFLETELVKQQEFFQLLQQAKSLAMSDTKMPFKRGRKPPRSGRDARLIAAEVRQMMDDGQPRSAAIDAVAERLRRSTRTIERIYNENKHLLAP